MEKGENSHIAAKHKNSSTIAHDNVLRSAGGANWRRFFELRKWPDDSKSIAGERRAQ